MDYEDIDKSLQIRLIEITSQDPYSLSPRTLFYNILNSSGSNESLAKIFEVDEELIKEIKDKYKKAR